MGTSKLMTKPILFCVRGYVISVLTLVNIRKVGDLLLVGQVIMSFYVQLVSILMVLKILLCSIIIVVSVHVDLFYVHNFNLYFKLIYFSLLIYGFPFVIYLAMLCVVCNHCISTYVNMYVIVV
jgi:hypothetical protein